MIQPTPTPTAPPAPVPGGVRLAAIFCWIVGLLSAGVSLAMGIPSLSAGGSLLLVVANVTAGIMVCVAGFLVWKQRRLGVLEESALGGVPGHFTMNARRGVHELRHVKSFALWVVVIGVVVLSGLLAAVAVARWLVVVQLVLWGRSHRRPE